MQAKIRPRDRVLRTSSFVLSRRVLRTSSFVIFFLLTTVHCPLSTAQEILVSTPIHSQQYSVSKTLFTLAPAPGQIGNIQDWKDQAGSVVTWVDKDGVLHALNGGGISSINGLVAFAQFDVVCSNGLDFNIQDSIDTHSFCIPDTSATARGLVTTGAQVLAGNKTFLGDITANSFTSTDPNTSNGISEMDCSTVTPTAGLDIICADQTAHAIQFSNNGGAFGSIPTGFPRLDQVLDPTGDKTFAMGAHKLSFVGNSPTTSNSLYLGPTIASLDAINQATITLAKFAFASQVSVAAMSYGVLGLNESSTVGAQPFGVVGMASSTATLGGNFITGVWGIADNLSASTTVASAFGVRASVGSDGGGPITTAYGMVVDPIPLGAVIGYGIFVDNQTDAITNYAIKTGLGQNSLGDRLTVKSNSAAVQKVTFTGAGLNDATSGGTYSGLDDLAYCVQIDASVPSPDTFEWGTGGSCSNGATGVGITGAAQNLSNGVQITFAAIDGHTIGDNWTFTAYAPNIFIGLDHNGNTTAILKELGDWHSRRYFADKGTALVAGDFVPSGGWGATSSVAVTSASTDQSFHITVTGAGGGYGLNPTVAFTFHDGTWTTVPVYVCSMETGGTGALSFFTPDNTSATVLTLTYAGTPGAATYKVACNAWGQ